MEKNVIDFDKLRDELIELQKSAMDDLPNQSAKVQITWTKKKGDMGGRCDITSNGTGFMITLGFASIVDSMRQALENKFGAFAVDNFNRMIEPEKEEENAE